jgi:hypothetical protein
MNRKASGEANLGLSPSPFDGAFRGGVIGQSDLNTQSIKKLATTAVAVNDEREPTGQDEIKSKALASLLL